MVDAVAATVGNAQTINALLYDFSAGQIVAIGAGALSSTAFSQGYTVACITATSNCWYRVGGTAAAHTAGSDYLPAGIKWQVKMPANATISVIQDAAAGYLAVMPARQTPI